MRMRNFQADKRDCGANPPAVWLHHLYSVCVRVESMEQGVGSQ